MRMLDVSIPALLEGAVEAAVKKLGAVGISTKDVVKTCLGKGVPMSFGTTPYAVLFHKGKSAYINVSTGIEQCFGSNAIVTQFWANDEPWTHSKKSYLFYVNVEEFKTKE